MVGGFNKKRQFTEWKTIRTAVMGDSLIAIQKKQEVYMVYYRDQPKRGMQELTRETGDVRYKVVAEKK